MPDVKLPLSGDVTQTINPWNWFLQIMGGQFGLININLGRSSSPDIEREVLDDVASYGKQLGRLSDALMVLIAHFHPARPLTEKEEESIAALKLLMGEIAAVKERHKQAST
jgi:hypothetical protein